MLGADPLQLLLMAPGLLAAIAFHEFAHAVTANALGDPTPRLTGRLSLNPLKHIDLVGLVMFLMVGFGWAKPVRTNPSYFRNPRQGMVWVSLSGPGMNLLLAFVGLVLLKLLPVSPQGWIAAILLGLYQFNLILAVFNVLPIPPLDGSRVLLAVARGNLARFLVQVEQYGWVLLLILLWFNMIGPILNPLIRAVAWALDTVSRWVVGV